MPKFQGTNLLLFVWVIYVLSYHLKPRAVRDLAVGMAHVVVSHVLEHAMTTLVSPGLSGARTCPDLGRKKRRWEREDTETSCFNHKWKKFSGNAYLEILSMIVCGELFLESGTTEIFWLFSRVDQFCKKSRCRFVSSSTQVRDFPGATTEDFYDGKCFM